MAESYAIGRKAVPRLPKDPMRSLAFTIFFGFLASSSAARYLDSGKARDQLVDDQRHAAPSWTLPETYSADRG